MVKKALYVRKRHTIEDFNTGVTTSFKSISLAKKESHKLQMRHDQALGRGSVIAYASR